MTYVPFRPRGIVESRSDKIKRIDSMTVKVQKVSGRVLINGSGEVSVFVPFAVNFIERPVFNYGGELDENERATAGRYPTISAVVVNWSKVKEIEGATEGYYIGSDVAVYTTGQTEQRIWLHYSFEGKAIRNPVVDPGDLEEPL